MVWIGRARGRSAAGRGPDAGSLATAGSLPLTVLGAAVGDRTLRIVGALQGPHFVPYLGHRWARLRAANGPLPPASRAGPRCAEAIGCARPGEHRLCSAAGDRVLRHAVEFVALVICEDRECFVGVVRLADRGEERRRRGAWDRRSTQCAGHRHRRAPGTGCATSDRTILEADYVARCGPAGGHRVRLQK